MAGLNLRDPADVVPYIKAMIRVRWGIPETAAAYDDMLSDGMEAWVTATASYDPTIGSSFNGYVGTKIRYGIIEGMRRRNGRYVDKRMLSLEASLQRIEGDDVEELAELAADDPDIDAVPGVVDMGATVRSLPDAHLRDLCVGLIQGRRKSEIAAERGITPAAITHQLKRIQRLIGDAA